MREREEFLREAQAAGCPEEQVRNFIAARVYLQPRQLAASAAAIAEQIDKIKSKL